MNRSVLSLLAIAGVLTVSCAPTRSADLDPRVAQREPVVESSYVLPDYEITHRFDYSDNCRVTGRKSVIPAGRRHIAVFASCRDGRYSKSHILIYDLDEAALSADYNISELPFPRFSVGTVPSIDARDRILGAGIAGLKQNQSLDYLDRLAAGAIVMSPKSEGVANSYSIIDLGFEFGPVIGLYPWWLTASRNTDLAFVQLAYAPIINGERADNHVSENHLYRITSTGLEYLRVLNPASGPVPGEPFCPVGNGANCTVTNLVDMPNGNAILFNRQFYDGEVDLSVISRVRLSENGDIEWLAHQVYELLEVRPYIPPILSGEHVVILTAGSSSTTYRLVSLDVETLSQTGGALPHNSLPFGFTHPLRGLANSPSENVVFNYSALHGLEARRASDLAVLGRYPPTGVFSPDRVSRIATGRHPGEVVVYGFDETLVLDFGAN
ncbi:MAG: hypothetical protein RKE49_06575 [Oceanicaulis sp.]